ncbi:MAG: metalloregulator ArsR/SmtB family transcription factor [Sphingomonas sp.]|uniref:ArsR/SmtB family transcription factor n=1 Tax=Sphingomonas sp. TaxID=28214 RepID=UPI0025EED98B|nr:metalloregulator ArsR/SmtB family transcription factor [Sphingomonas sp.]MBY0283616.1 metalloregulator ArsR/SmtB family transcription factor [Sphingomonas sp.]
MNDSGQIIAALGALAQSHRLAAFRALVEAGPAGLPAGDIATRLGIAASSLSFHLAQLERAGLVRAVRAGRSIIYSADFAAMTALVGYLTENCCGGGVCTPADAALPTERNAA